MFQTTLTYIAWFSSALFCIKLFIMFIGTDTHSGDHDLSGDHSADVSFKILSFQSVIAFLMGFGWLGKACVEDWHLSEGLTILIACLFGFVVMGIYVVLMRLIFKLNSVSTHSYEECIGKTGTIYMSIPQSGKGQVEVSYAGRIDILDAVGLAGAPFPINTTVQIVGAQNNTLIVKEFKND